MAAYCEGKYQSALCHLANGNVVKFTNPEGEPGDHLDFVSYDMVVQVVSEKRMRELKLPMRHYVVTSYNSLNQIVDSPHYNPEQGRATIHDMVYEGWEATVIPPPADVREETVVFCCRGVQT